ncbi:MAG: TetR/AcrR family transcriptional regulator [Sphingomonadales bacterium]
MPPPVDHEARRKQVAAIAATLLAKSGLEGVTFRDIAKAAGYSTAIVSHYFHNKRELMTYIFRSAAQGTVAKVDEELAAGKPMQECVEWLLPLDEARTRDWQVWIAFWGHVANDPEMLEEQQRRGREALDMCRRVLEREYRGLDIDERTVELRARRLLTMVTGLATETVFDPEQWPPERQRAVLADEIATIRR